MDGKHLIRVEFSGESTPYSAYGKYYLRTADEDRAVTPEQLKTFFNANKYKGQWEKEESTASIKQIDKSSINRFRQRVVSVGRIPDGKYSCTDILATYDLSYNASMMVMSGIGYCICLENVDKTDLTFVPFSPCANVPLMLVTKKNRLMGKQAEEFLILLGE